MRNDFFRPASFTEPQAYIWSMEEASFRPRQRWFNGRLIELQRGEFVTSYNVMANTFGWTVKTVRNFVARMVRAGLWSKRRAFKGAKAPTVIYICNYDKIQIPPRLDGTEEGNEKVNSKAKQGPAEGTEQKEWNKKQEMNGEDAEVGALGRSHPEDQAVAIEVWNANAAECGWPLVREPISSTRSRRLGSQLERVGIEGWKKAVQRASWSEYLGNDPPTWFNFDAILDPDKFDRLLEGNYDRLSESKMNGWIR